MKFLILNLNLFIGRLDPKYKRDSYKTSKKKKNSKMIILTSSIYFR